MASRRNYLTQPELAQYADITITDTTEADDQISMAEELIDAYVGPQPKFFEYELLGLASAGGASTITLQQKEVNVHDIDYFKWCQVEIIGGTGAGQRRTVTASTLAGVLTVASAWDTAPDSTSFYKIYQLGKFPRQQDATFFSESTPSTYYKSIPEAVKRAVAAQVEYVVAMGPTFFSTNKSTLESESIGDYSYSRGGGQDGVSSLNALIAPKAAALLRGIRNRLGVIIND